VHVIAPSRGADFTAILREVALELAAFDDACLRYHLRFANEADSALAFDFEPSNVSDLFEIDRVLVGAEPGFIADLVSAEVTSISSVSVSIDAGLTPPPGGGIEVRMNDFGWGLESHRNLIGRFSTRTFTVPRLTRTLTFYLRQFDSSGRYSRYSAALHIDYPV
jgi:hypothetical protein